MVTDMWFAYQASQSISVMESDDSRLDDPDRIEQLVQARAMNAMLAGVEASMPYEDIRPYREQLKWQTPYMGWLEIPKIAVSMPLYHGVDEEVLAEGAGHVENTSLPVGGVPSNCAISAHSGLRTARMFDDVRRLKAGDKICVHTLAEPYAYEVRDTEVVLPEEVEGLHIYEDGTDMLTLVTCTPLGINDHRLLVHCVRVAYDPADFETVPAEAYLNSRTVPPLAVGLAVFLVSVASLVLTARARKRKRKGTASGACRSRRGTMREMEDRGAAFDSKV